MELTLKHIEEREYDDKTLNEIKRWTVLWFSATEHGRLYDFSYNEDTSKLKEGVEYIVTALPWKNKEGDKGLTILKIEPKIPA